MSALREAMSHAVLGWVKPELDQTLRLVRGEIEAFAENPADPSRMHVCVGYLHQVQGTLHMVELYAPAMVAEELEKLAQALQDDTTVDANEACATLMRGTVLLPDYLERLQSGHRDIPIVLLPLLNDIRAARGESGLNESVLFAPDLDRPLPQEVPATEPMAGGTRDTRLAQACDHFERVLAGWPEDAPPADAAALAAALQPLQRLVEHTVARRMLWVAASVAEAMRDGAMPASPGLHQAFAGVARVVRQIRQGLVPGAAAPGQEPTRQLLYQVAHSEAMHPALDDLRKAFDLDATAPSQAEIEHARSSISGRNRALLDTVGGAVKEELMQVKDALDLQLRTGDDIAGLAPQVAQLGSIADTLGMMGQGLSRNVVLQQRDSLAELVDGRRALDESALLDIAGALLYVDASLDDQVANLGEEGEVGQQANETQTTVEVLAGEAIRNFAEVRHQFVAFIEMEWDHGQLGDSPRLLDEVGGALRMLELSEPADYVEGVRRYIATELIERKRVPSGTQLDTLADAMASLEYYLEALREHRPNRDELMDITRSSLEALRYWPLPAVAAAAEQAPVVEAPAVEAPPAEAPAVPAPEPELALVQPSVPEAATPAQAYEAPVHDMVEPVDMVTDDADGSLIGGVEIERGPELPEFVPDEAAAAPFDPVASEFAEFAEFADRIPVAGQLPVDAIAPTTPEPVSSPSVEDAADDVHATGAPEDLLPVAQAPVAEAVDTAADAGGFALETGFDASGQDIDDEIRDVFLEEFDEEITALRDMLPAWQADPENLERLRSIRRVFHTLKGSGRLVGARQLGEFSWKVENMLNRVLDGTRAPTPAVVALLLRATETLPRLNDALRGVPGAHADLAGIEAVAERIAHGEEAIYEAPLSTPAVQPADDAVAHEVDTQEAFAPPPPAVQDAEGTPASVDSVLREILQAEVANHLSTVDAWLAGWDAERGALQANEGLLRAFHTVNGAFAMADVPEITEVTGRAEQFVKRLLSNAMPADALGVAGVAAAAAAIRHTVVALQAEQPRIPPFSELRDQLDMLCDRLPQASRPMSMLVDDSRQNSYTNQSGVSFAPDAPADIALTDTMDLSRFIDAPEALEASLPTTVPPPSASEDKPWFSVNLGYRTDPARIEAPAADAVTTSFDAPPEAALDPVSEVSPEEATNLDATQDTSIEAHAVHDMQADVEALAEDAMPPTGADVDPAALLEPEADAPTAEGAPDAALTLEEAGDDLAGVELTGPEAAADAMAWADALPDAQVQEALGTADTATDADTVMPAGEEPAFDDASVQFAEEVPPAAGLDATPGAIEGEALPEDGVDAQSPVEAFEASHALEETAPSALDVETAAEAVPEQPAAAAAMLDFEQFDRDLVDIFVEEGQDLLDHSDGLLARLRETPDDRNLVIGLQRDLHTIKGGARMAGIEAIGDLGHAIESLLEQIAEHRADVDRGVIGLLERGFDVLHGMLGTTATYHVVEPQPALVAEFDDRARGDSAPAAGDGFATQTSDPVDGAAATFAEDAEQPPASSEVPVPSLEEPQSEAAQPEALQEDASGFESAQVDEATHADPAQTEGLLLEDQAEAHWAEVQSQVGEPAAEAFEAEAGQEETFDAEPAAAEVVDSDAAHATALPLDEVRTDQSQLEAGGIEAFASEERAQDVAGEALHAEPVDAGGFQPEPPSVESLDYQADTADTAETAETAETDAAEAMEADLLMFEEDMQDVGGTVALDAPADDATGDAVASSDLDFESALAALDDDAGAGSTPLAIPYEDATPADAVSTPEAFEAEAGLPERAPHALPDPVVVAEVTAPVPVPVLPVQAAVSVPQPIAHLAPLSAPIDLPEAAEEESSTLSTGQEQVRVRADLLDQLVNNAGEVAIYRARLEQQMGAFRAAMAELDRTNTRLHDQLRRLDLETEAQIVARYQREQDTRDAAFDPLELDRFSTLQQLSRALGESAADISGLQGVLDDLARQNDSLLGQQSRVSSELQDGLMRARMVPFEGSVPRLRRVLRQAAQETGKQAQLQLEGAHGELDRNVLERMTAPLEHLLRNAVAHGLESPQARRDAGKPEDGTVHVVLRREGSEMVLQVADDGAGIDHAAIRRRAEQRGIIQPGAELAAMDLERLILEPGFSTAEEVSQLAGRGVGMDVVHNEVRQLGGTLEIASVRGAGTTFTLRLPQTLAVTQAVFVQVGETQFAVSVAAIGGVGRLSRQRFESGAAYVYGGEEYALYDMGTLVGLDPAKAEGQPVVPLLLIRAGELRAAVAVDQVLGNREIVVKPVGPQIGSIPGIYGATITGDGSVVVILDAPPLVRRYITQPASIAPAVPAAEQRQVPLVMVVDDSLTMRKVTGRVLERHNFEVSTARDGVEALERLEERVPDLMLLDIEMPRMDGYELATAMKADPRFAGVPIVMITSRTGEKHRQRALEIGVQRYMGKPYQELDLMRNVYDLLGIARVRD